MSLLLNHALISSNNIIIIGQGMVERECGSECH